MDGLCRAIGAPTSVRLAGRTYMIEPLTLGRLGAIEHHLLAQRCFPTDTATEMILAVRDEGLKEKVWKRAFKDLRKQRELRIVTFPQMRAFLVGPAGVAYSAWLMLESRYPELRHLEEVEALLQRCSKEEVLDLVRRRDMVSGLDAVAEADWPNAEEQRRSGRPDRTRPEDEKYKPLPWKKYIRNLSEARNFSKREIEGWTLFELQIQLRDEADLGGTMRVEAEDAAHLAGRQGKKVVTIGNSGKGLAELRRLQQQKQSPPTAG